ncbi:uncharacterized protein LOC110866705 [Helianthus annuus]|uniref:uncharacterized protein LOC110866705 n=1 Tax=Helianthus annuus TaxID=4232 RepID=UPI001652C92B|nr:uncharacterized protein LOC110866705 [Helianthus annuus]
MENVDRITLLNDIDVLTTNYTIKVKIVSLWRKKMRDNERETYRIDMILMDEKGSKIQASCMHKLFSKFERHLNVDECLIIKWPSLAANTASFKIVPNNQKLTFYYHTFVEKCNVWDGPQYVFNFVEFNDVLSMKIKEGTTVDFIGYVGVCYNIEDTNKKDGSKGKRLNLKLQDLEDVQIDLTLWDDHAKDMYSYMISEKREAHVVVVVHFGAVKSYKGKWGLSNNFDGSRVFINDNFDDMLLFKQKFLAKLSASSESSSHAGSYMTCSPKKVVVVGTIVAIVSDKMWYYDGCNYCKSKVEKKFETYDKDDGTSDVRDTQLYQCSNKDCNGKEVFPMSRFKIPVRVQDSTGTVTLTLFDHEAMKFVRKTAKELIQIQDELLQTNDFPREYPVEFEELLNQKCAFVIKVTDFNIANGVENYGISVVTTDDDILDKLNKKFKIDQIDAYETFGMSQSELQTSGAEGLKDADSYTGDNTTPISKDYAVDLKQSSSDMKRNLDDVYLNEVGLASSAILSIVLKMHNRFEQLKSYYSERPHIDLENKSEQAKCRRSLRKLYIDNKRSNAAAFPEYVVRALEAKHRRKLRKLYLDRKRSNVTKKLISRGGTSTSSSSTPIRLNNKENFTPNISNTTFPTESSTAFGTSNHLNSSFNVRSPVITQSTLKKKGNVLHDQFSTPIRTPLANLSNTMPDNIASSSTLPLNDCFSLHPRISNKRNTTFLSSELSSIKKMSSGKRRLIHKPIEIQPIPMAALDSDDENHVNEVVLDATKGVSKDYVDHGDQTLTCGLCFANLWPTEGGKGRITLQKQTYSLCCGYGKVDLPEYKDSDPSYQMLFRGLDQESKYFLKNIRRYNSMFSFTSMGGKVDTKINKGNAPFVYRISCQNAHSMGSLLPKHGAQPKFSQLYIYDTENELSNRELLFSDSSSKASIRAKELDVKFIKYITNMLDSTNMLVKTYRMVRDHLHDNPNVTLKLRIISQRDRDGRTYNLPTCSEVAALIVDEPDLQIESRDIIVEMRSGDLKRISELHPSYLALQYPILFPYGDDGYRINIPHREFGPNTKKTRPTCTMREFFAFRIQDRHNKFSLILNARRLFQQFLVDAYTMIESERLNYIRFQQIKLRSDSLNSLKNVQDVGQSDLSHTGQPVILPSSFTGGSRYMMQNYLDAMALCRKYGYPDFFITITCNPKWPEIVRFLGDSSIKPEDRPDILCRLFKMKLDELIKDMKQKKIFGDINAVVYTVEFQKRGLPHAHICLFMKADHKLPTVEHIDPFISAEIPDKNEDPELYSLVSDFMIHGPCGYANMKCPCMVGNRCSKNFPKRFLDSTSIDSDGFPVYRRRDSGHTVVKKGVPLDNRSVVPYNKNLLKRYQAHINVEWCNQAGSIKYLFKYINKGPDRATVAVFDSDRGPDEEIPKDEIKEYYEARYVSACEASWRIFGNDVHYRYPSVMRLPFHLPGQQNVVFSCDDDIEDVLNKPQVNSSIFLEWMKMNNSKPEARQLTYVDFPTKYVWKLKDRCWQQRQNYVVIGRIYSASPSLGEAYYLRILLTKVKGPRSFEEIRTYDGVVYPTFRDACYARGLLDDDNEYIECIKESSFTGNGHYLRSLFATLLLSNTLSRPEVVWEKTWELLSEDILYNMRKDSGMSDFVVSEERLKNITLSKIEKFLLRNGSSLHRFSPMPYPDDDYLMSESNRLINEELSFDMDEVTAEFNNLHSCLNADQRAVYNEIMDAIRIGKGGVFFVYGYGGTGKTFLWKTLGASIRCNGQIVINVASSGIASLLLSRGRTAHSRFHIPINLNEDSVCHIKPNTEIANLLYEAKLIIWDEAPMIHKHAFEALDRTMKDVLSVFDSQNSELPFGGKTIVFGGDFRQILPVVQNGSRQDIVNASLCSSHIWSSCKVLKLTINMRLSVGSSSSNVMEINEFGKWLLDIGEGNVGDSIDGDGNIEIPAHLLITDDNDPIQGLIDFVYPSVLHRYKDRDYFSERAILAPKNEVVHEINDRLLDLFPGEEVEYLSSDSLCPTEEINDPLHQDLYNPDVLNSVKVSGLPNHRLVLKLGVPVMLLRNIDQQNGLCNGTRLQITRLGKRVIEAEILSGSNVGSRTYIPRISMIPSDKKIPFKFQRRQFPITVCFAMTINKSQGQSLSRVGIYLRDPVFSHGQLYVALSRVKTKDGVKVLIFDKDGRPTNKTANVVYKEIFGKL